MLQKYNFLEDKLEETNSDLEEESKNTNNNDDDLFAIVNFF